MVAFGLPAANKNYMVALASQPLRKKIIVWHWLPAGTLTCHHMIIFSAKTHRSIIFFQDPDALCQTQVCSIIQLTVHQLYQGCNSECQERCGSSSADMPLLGFVTFARVVPSYAGEGGTVGATRVRTWCARTLSAEHL